ncbi:MAG: hypothetical protein AXA67_05610 [Methylothermaceae bacteria B42]|nr:MAG: hypothetical protein AXA67_05610 [Methylothermaceae bacteria B42]HHJ40329.1 hypothetical protein [Methylothermaceae bacterium]
MIKIFPLLLLACLATLSFANEPSPNYKARYYLSLRGVQGQGLDRLDLGRPEENEGRVRAGLRYWRKLGQRWKFNTDLRVVYLYQKLKNLRSLPGQNTANDIYFEARQLYLEAPYLWDDLPLGILLGRKQFRDPRSWWYDNQLDVLQLQFNTTLLTGELAFGGRVVEERQAGSAEEQTGLKDSMFVIGHLDHHYYYGHHVEGYLIYENSDVKKNQIGRVVSMNEIIRPKSEMVWIGARAHGTWKIDPASSIRYWLDAGTVVGQSQNLSFEQEKPGKLRVNGFETFDVNGGIGFDIGAAWFFHNETIGLAFDYALGTGKGNDNLYLQPSIANNKGRLFGTIRYRYYGEFLNPNLSNLQIISGFAGIKLAEQIWLEAAYHHYRQLNPENRLRAARLSIAPNGQDEHIGDAVDLVIGGRWGERAKLQFVASGFRGGNAYRHQLSSRYAYRLTTTLTFYW